MQDKLAPRIRSSPGRAPTLRRQISWTLPANLIYGGCNFVLLMALNKWSGSDAAGVEAAGRFHGAMILSAPLFMFANLRFSSLLATDSRLRHPVSDYFIIRIALLVAVGLTVTALAGYLAMQGEWARAMLVLAVAGTKAVEAISDLCCGLQQRAERMDRIAISLITNGIAMMAAFVTVYQLTQNVVAATVGLLAARVAVLACVDIPWARAATPRPTQAESELAPFPTANVQRASRLRQLFLLGLPLGITATLLSLTSNTPKYILQNAFGDGMLGIYGSVAATMQAGNLLFRAVELPALPRLAKLLNAGSANAFWKLLVKLMAVFLATAAAGSMLCLLIGGPVLGLLFNAEYASLGPLLAFVVAGTAIAQIAGIIESSLIAARLTSIQLPMHGITVALSLILSLALIPRWEIYGAVLAVTICRFPFMAIGVWLLRQKLTSAVSTHPTDDEQHRARRAA